VGRLSGFPCHKHLGIPTPHPGPLPVEGRGRWQRVAELRRRFKLHHGWYFQDAPEEPLRGRNPLHLARRAQATVQRTKNRAHLRVLGGRLSGEKQGIIHGRTKLLG
jgi:hypothetical protein